jgi:hypothetical protein
VVRVSGYRGSGPGFIPRATWFFEKWWVWNGFHSASWVATPVYKTEITTVRDQPRWLRDTPLSAKFGTNFADKRRSLGRLVRSRTQVTEFSLDITTPATMQRYTLNLFVVSNWSVKFFRKQNRESALSVMCSKYSLHRIANDSFSIEWIIFLLFKSITVNSNVVILQNECLPKMYTSALSTCVIWFKGSYQQGMLSQALQTYPFHIFILILTSEPHRVYQTFNFTSEL